MSGPVLRGKSYIFIETWNETYAIELGFTMHTYDIMNLIEKQMGIPKEQQRHTHQGKQFTTKKHSNNTTSKRTIP